ncbi:S1C family serine protease [Haloferula sp.]|uniref:S1C family serine protease n=1 Tax=Haloferula sp. TaxID=2497595 RepID=UPI003C7380DF
MMKNSMKSLLIFAAMAVSSLLPAQDVPLQRPDERLETRRQSAEVFDAIRPVARKASASTVWVWVKGRQVAIGTVVGDGSQVLTKWSEIGINYDSIQVVGGDGRDATATVLGVYQDEDIALLQLDGAQFTPVTWSEQESPPVGRFLVAAGPDDNPLGFGVVAVAERVLRETDQAFIGVELGEGHDGAGVLIRGVDERGGADEAGVLAGDVILELGGKEINSAFELRGALLSHEPGEILPLKLLRNGKELEVQVELFGRPEFPQFPQARLNAMRAMGGPLSVVGTGFPTVIQTDMELKPNRCGGPIVDLQGNVIGMSISRTDRTRSFILSASVVRSILGQEGTSPELAEVPKRGGRQLAGGGNRPRAVPMNPGSADRLRQHLEEMQTLLQRMDREMAEIGE